MKLNEALKAMIDGEKITCEGYSDGSYSYWNTDKDEVWFYSAAWRSRSKAESVLSYKDGYEIYKEPKKKGKYWLWLDPNDCCVTTHVYDNDGENRGCLEKATRFTVKLEWSEVSL
jgi:hypothetical protein